MSRSKPDEVASTIAKTFLWIGGGIGIFMLVSTFLMLAWLGYILIRAGRPQVQAPQVQLSTQPHLRYLITVRPTGQTEFLPTSAHVEVAHVIRGDRSGRSCLPSSLEKGTDYPYYPVKELPEVNVADNGSVAFIATYDYIKREDYYGRGTCHYGISAAHLTLQDGKVGFRVPLSWRVFDDFADGESTSFLFCISGKDFAVPSSEGLCRSHLDNLPEEAELSFLPDFIIEAKRI